MCSVRLDMYVRDKMNISRHKAQELIFSESVKVNGNIVTKPAFSVNDDSVEICADTVLRYVGRGGFKLEKACDAFDIDIKDKLCIDIGASTGGFTDCMLQRGAARVYSVDVGNGQLDEKLKKDSRVISLENTDIRDADIEKADFIGCDVSFISLKLILPHIKRLLKLKGLALVLIKPQFEAGREAIGKRGIVKSPSVHKKVIRDIVSKAEEEGLYAGGLDFSPIKGGDGNIEYILLLSCQRTGIDIDDVVKRAFDAFKKR